MIEKRPEFERLVAANRILYREGVVDGLGHVSIRHPDDPELFVMARSRAPGLVEFEDLMEFRLDGTPIDLRGRTVYGERIIHGCIYEARPEVRAVVHNHSPAVLPFAVTKTPMRPVIHTASIIGDEVPVWDIRDTFGRGTDMLVRSIEQGRDLAKGLGKCTCVLMRGHGATVAEKTLQLAVFAAIYLQLNAQVISQAMPFGEPVALTPEEAAGHNAVLASPLAGDRMWEYYCMRAGVDVC
ncbi:MAG: class II aldolase/adducin family protein [Beijerinckiaceae bacterium]